MVSSISSGMSMPPPPPPRSEQKLSEQQQTLISDTLSEFDPDNLTQADAISIVEAFTEAGIKPGNEMESAISELGFDGKTIGDLANVEGGDRPAPPPPPQSSVEISSMVSYLGSLLEEKLASINGSELSDQDRQDIYSQVMEKFDIEEGDSIINTTA
ncbi:MAG: hypothetical protein ACJAT7_000465 [Psychromonas sp.]|jgi:hypothetical protein|uniref:hypothetical protein n=1 Tax=Psychromonas sp. TaxID=1884585 RepID=UPI0039E32581